MNEITKIAYEKTLVEMSQGDSILQSLAIIAMLAFVIWNIKLIFEPAQEEKITETAKAEIKIENIQ
jgi:hypothetical protein